MINDLIKQISPTNQGNLILIAGIILLLNVFDLVKGLNVLIGLIAVCMVWYGFVQAGWHTKIQNLINRKR